MLRKAIKSIIKHNVIGEIIEFYRHWKPYFEWLESGKPDPPPNIVKQMTIKEYANKYRLKVFIESGTYLGDMVYAVRGVFEKIYSIELDDNLYESAKAKFLKYSHMSILHGDSAKVMPKILEHIQDPCLFWLDGHYSAGITSKGEIATPILQELRHIFSHTVKDHVILIDDARLFIGKNDYPNIQELRSFVLGQKHDREIEIKDDIIRIHKK
jgi:hypothetical protein